MSRDFVFSNYEEAIDFLFQGPDLERLASNSKYEPPRFNLERVERFLAYVGNPHRKLKAVHVAGTKGKGSTAFMIARFLEEAGYVVGLFTSPHLVHLEERITVNGVMIPREEVRRLLSGVRDYVDGERKRDIDDSPTFFEVFTVMAFMYFSEFKMSGVDWVVLEVGMGGRLDATNVVTPRVSVITEIGMDHMEFLGNTLGQIAREKAGIIKEGVPVVSCPVVKEAVDVIESRCKEKKARHYLVGRDIEIESVNSIPLEGVECDIKTWARGYNGLRIPLLGEHQARNCACALGVMELLSSEQGVGWTEEMACRGLSRLRCPARIEIISRIPLIVLDAAHNIPSIQVLVGTLKNDIPFRRLVLVLGLSRDKDVDGILKEIVPLADELILTTSGYPRAAEPQFLRERVKELFGREGHIVPEASDALEEAKRLASPEDCICITGSFYLAGKLGKVSSNFPLL